MNFKSKAIEKKEVFFKQLEEYEKQFSSNLKDYVHELRDQLQADPEMKDMEPQAITLLQDKDMVEGAIDASQEGHIMLFYARDDIMMTREEKRFNDMSLFISTSAVALVLVCSLWMTRDKYVPSHALYAARHIGIQVVGGALARQVPGNRCISRYRDSVLPADLYDVQAEDGRLAVSLDDADSSTRGVHGGCLPDRGRLHMDDVDRILDFGHSSDGHRDTAGVVRPYHGKVLEEE